MLKLLMRKKSSKLTSDQIKEPFLRHVEHSLEREDYHAAVAFLNSAIELLPDDLELYFQRGQVTQFGLCDFCSALKDYRHIMSRLEHSENAPLFRECKAAIGDMMHHTP